MNIDTLYKMSLCYGPPEINFQQAEICDGAGSDAFAKLKVDHTHPNDVKEEELKYYPPSIFCFMESRDLLFYLYAVHEIVAKKGYADHVDSFVWKLNRELPNILKIMRNEHHEIFKLCIISLYTTYGYAIAWGGLNRLSDFCDFSSKDNDESEGWSENS